MSFTKINVAITLNLKIKVFMNLLNIAVSYLAINLMKRNIIEILILGILIMVYLEQNFQFPKEMVVFLF
jgi:hypothetical protein